MKNNRLAKILCVVFAVLLVGVYIFERRTENESYKKYEEMIPVMEQQRQNRKVAAQQQAERREIARKEYKDAIDTYLPGIVFYGDSIMTSAQSNGFDLRLILNTLVRVDVCNTNTAVVDITQGDVEPAKYSGYLPIVFLGADVDLGNVQQIIAQQRQLINGSSRYIIIGPVQGRAEDMAYFELMMTQEYGENYINAREFMSEDGIKSMELTATPEDRAAMSEGRVPPAFFSEDGIHLNDTGIRLLSYMTYERMQTLGYFTEIVDAKKVYESNGGTDI